MNSPNKGGRHRRGTGSKGPERVPEREEVPAAEGVRLQKVLAAAGFGSRRKCEEIIIHGRVTVNGSVVDVLGARVDPVRAVIRVDGERIGAPPASQVFALNKPRGVITAMSDPHGRACVGDLVADSRINTQGLFHVGRLDADTDGLLLLTNDGDLAHRLTHPSFGVFKTYVVTTAPQFSPTELARLRKGIVIDDRAVEVSRARLLAATKQNSLVEVQIHEGRNRIVRRIWDELGLPVHRLTRTAFGSAELGGLGPGAIRQLSDSEVASLYDHADGSVG